MTERAPAETTNLDRYGSPSLARSRAHDLLTVPSQTDRFFLGTVGPDGRPHAAGVGALWCDGDLYVVSGPGTRKSRNLAANPAGTISAALRGIDLVFEGEATRVTDGPTLDRLAGLYREQGWPAEAGGCARGRSWKGTASSATGSASLTAGCRRCTAWPRGSAPRGARLGRTPPARTPRPGGGPGSRGRARRRAGPGPVAGAAAGREPDVPPELLRHPGGGRARVALVGPDH